MEKLTHGDREFIQSGPYGPYGQLAIEYVHKADGDQIVALFNGSLTPSYIHIRFEGGRRLIIVTTPRAKLQDLVNIATSRTPSTLESFTVNSLGPSLTARLSQGKIYAMAMTIKQLCYIDSGGLEFIQQGHLTQLTLESFPRKADKDRLAEILRHNPELRRLQIRSEKDHDPIAADSPDMELGDSLDLVTPGTLSKLESFLLDCQRFTLTASFSQGKTEDVIMNVEKLDDLRPDDLVFIHEGPITRLVIESTPWEVDMDRLTEILRHSPNLGHLQIRFKDDDRSIAETPVVELQDLMKLTTSEIPNRLESFSVSCRRLSLTASFFAWPDPRHIHDYRTNQ